MNTKLYAVAVGDKFAIPECIDPKRAYAVKLTSRIFTYNTLPHAKNAAKLVQTYFDSITPHASKRLTNLRTQLVVDQKRLAYVRATILHCESQPYKSVQSKLLKLVSERDRLLDHISFGKADIRQHERDIKKCDKKTAMVVEVVISHLKAI